MSLLFRVIAREAASSRAPVTMLGIQLQHSKRNARRTEIWIVAKFQAKYTVSAFVTVYGRCH